ncbi:MAG TPA: AAA family ATPase, partial [Acidimicrobiia bacterium]|nr:AAA family ATPase [Acidimicrobiia bacterium]
LADQHHWRVVLVGDPRQFAAVGRGGLFAHLVDKFGAVELDQIHRFQHQWERQASLHLRTGDPSVLTEYDRHGRIHDGPPERMQSEVIAAWKEARGRGETVALMANTTDTVHRLNELAQQTRIEAGELDPSQRGLQVGDHQRLLVGDEVVTRRNDRRLRTHLGIMVKNRNHWTVNAIHHDGSVTATGPSGKIRLPADYVARDLELGYAQTSHATQGRTVDTSLLLVDGPTDSRGVYTPMTRGREANHVYVVTEHSETGLDLLGLAVTRDWVDHPAIARRDQLDPRRPREPLHPGAEDSRERMMRRARQRIIERQEQRRQVEPTLSRSL